MPTTFLTPESIPQLQDEVRALAREREAVILAHNYQLPEIQQVADYVGDSLGLSRQAAASSEPVIAFCGVHFMAETASILSPEKTVLLPDLDAGCSLADSIDAAQLRAWKADHPGAVVVMYVNTTAEVKAETDYCVTSSNAVRVVEHIYCEHGEDTEILFGPDMFLGSYVERTIGRPMHVWDGECHVHAGIRPLDITTRAAGCSAFQARSWSASIESESEQPASGSGIRTVLPGERIDAVSAMKCTPQKAIASASVAAAWRERPSESPR